MDDYRQAELLSKNIMQMALRLVTLEKRVATAKIGRAESSRSQLIERLKMAKELSRNDSDAAINAAEDALLEYIDDEEVSKIYGQIERFN